MGRPRRRWAGISTMHRENIRCVKYIGILRRAVSKKPSTAKATEGRGQSFICPLSKMRVGAACRIKQLSTSPEMARRLRELGFCEEQRVKLLSQQDNVICQVCNVRLGISAELADAILVEPLHKEEQVA